MLNYQYPCFIGIFDGFHSGLPLKIDGLQSSMEIPIEIDDFFRGII